MKKVMQKRTKQTLKTNKRICNVSPTQFVLTCRHQLYQGRLFKKLTQEVYTPILGLGPGDYHTGMYNVTVEDVTITLLQHDKVCMSFHCSHVAHQCQPLQTMYKEQLHPSFFFVEKPARLFMHVYSNNPTRAPRLAYKWTVSHCRGASVWITMAAFMWNLLTHLLLTNDTVYLQEHAVFCTP